MDDTSKLKPYEEWSDDPFERRYNAAYNFGYHLMEHCRAEALKDIDSAKLPKNRKELQAQVEHAVDIALHNVMDLLEGFWETKAGPNHWVRYALAICVQDESDTLLDRIEISPSRMDLPIGYWAWKDGQFSNPG